MTCNQPQGDPESVLFLFAHNDDEFFVLPRLERECAQGHKVICVYTTDGAAYGESPDRRLGESKSVLCPRGVSDQDIIPLGAQLGIRDGSSYRAVDGLWEQLQVSLQNKRFSRVYVPAWEGGHADHDAAHLLGCALARVHGCEVIEFSLYNGFGSIGPLFRRMSLIPLEGDDEFERVTLADSISWAFEARRYPSQRRAFIGLLPFCLPQILLRRSLPLRRVERREYRCRPHSGRLFYEVRFKVPYEEFDSATRGFIDRFVDPPV